MFLTLRVPTLFIAAGLFLAACTGSGATAAPPSPAAANPGAPTGAAVTVTTTGLGMVLVGPAGRTLYIDGGDSMNVSTCTGSCAMAWPPLTVPAGQQPAAGPGVTGKLGTFTRPDGATQATYNGLPLYYWQGDAKAGDVTGKGVDGFIAALASGTTPVASPHAPATPGGYSY